MVKFRKKFLAVLLTAAMVLSMSSVVAWSDEAPDASTDAAVSEESGDASGEEGESGSSAVLTDEQGLAETKKIAENSKYALYLNEDTTNFALQSKDDNHVWWSSPLNTDADAIAKPAQRKNMKSPFYIWYGDMQYHNSQKLSAYDGSISGKDFQISDIENGVRIDYHFEKIDLTIPMTITLTDDSVKVSVLTSEIKEPAITDTEGDVLLSIGMYQYFGAGSTDDEGYMIVPDGSGAVINFNNQRIGAQEYSNKIYGRDTSVTQLKRPNKTEQVYLPVYGMVYEESGKNHGFMAICESGETCANVKASVSGQNATSYNTTWYEFDVRTEDTYYMGTRLLTVFEGGAIDQPTLTIGYYPLVDEDLSYVDIANEYRDYLMTEKGLTEKKDNIKPSYYLDFYGGTVKAQSILGFPVNLDTPATTYEQAQEIMQKLKELGVEDIVVNYNDFNAAGIKGLISAGVDYAGTLGGKNNFTNLLSYAQSENANIFPSVGITYMKDSGNGYSYSLNASKQTTKAYATVNNWDIAFGIPHQVKLVTKTTLSPYYWEDLFRKLREDFSKENIKTISIGDATTLLYSDFSRGDYSRYDAMNEICKGLQQFKDSGFTILADGANAYALPYVDYLTNVPLTSSNFDVFDYDIPFYSLVIHGVIPYTTKAINASANATDTIMLALSTGTPVHYDMMYTDPNDFTDCDYDTLFYSNYKGWLEPSANAYKLVKDNLTGVMNQKITGYERVSGDEIKTTFEDGTVVTVNTRTITFTVNGKEIDLAQYGLKGETNE